MGAVLSQAKTLWLGLKLLLQLRRDLAAVLARARAPPGLPVPRPTAPYWLADPPFPELVRARVPAALPARADVVVIGTGVTGAAAARSLLSSSSSPKPRVVVLDARTLCSGATGRNGGHIKASPHELFARLREAGGMDPARAAELVRFQLRHLEVLVQLCEAEGWDVAECREVETVDLYLDEQGRDKAFAQVRELAKWVPECEIAMWDADAAREKFGPNDAVVGAISYRAGALWPFRLVSCVWADLLAAYPDSLSLQTETPVEGIAPCGGERGGFVVSTPRGDIECAHVVHATNAFATQLVPGLRGKMTGFRAHMTAQRPGAQFPASGGARSWSIMYGSAFDYVTQRPSTVEEDGTEVPGDLMLGG
ncbi:FAD dependent oxidoreductase-domain-containing protein, partial [Xylariomycetidae sp. FL0641]